MALETLAAIESTDRGRMVRAYAEGDQNKEGPPGIEARRPGVVT
jgi:hypothetical protein